MVKKDNDKVNNKNKEIKIKYSSNAPIPPPVPPKRPSSYFMLFRKDIITAMKEKPNLVLSLRKIAEIAKEIWEETDEITKERYRKKGEALMQLYKLEKEKYEKKYGKIKRKTRRPNRVVAEKDILESSSDSD